MEQSLTDGLLPFDEASADHQFAAAVAAFGMKLRDSEHDGNIDWMRIEEIATGAQGTDRSGYRAQFLTLLRTASELHAGTLADSLNRRPVDWCSRAERRPLPGTDDHFLGKTSGEVHGCCPARRIGRSLGDLVGIARRRQVWQPKRPPAAAPPDAVCKTSSGASAASGKGVNQICDRSSGASAASELASLRTHRTLRTIIRRLAWAEAHIFRARSLEPAVSKVEPAIDRQASSSGFRSLWTSAPP